MMHKNNRLLTVCPSVRPKRLVKMMETWNNTQTTSQLTIGTKPGCTTHVINEAFRKNPGFDYYHIANDDFVYETVGWDAHLIRAIESRKSYGIAFPDDGFRGSSLPAVSIISGNLVRAVGWLQLPSLCYLCGDLVWQHIGRELNCIWKVPQVKIIHEHYLNKKADRCEYEETNSLKTRQRDTEAFRRWVAEDAKTLISDLRWKLELKGANA